MPSYPIRPMFPIDVRSPSGTVTVGRQGAAVTVDVVASSTAAQITAGQFYSALENAFPGASATVRDAVPSDVTSAVNRAYRTTAFVVPGCVLLGFIQATLSLSDAQIEALLVAATLQPK
ncbi:hypothetical protein [Methylobacterium sp. AMS5]|uniref:hypothetical protein n=1 Tax=Methylobacterium sp. AMS5 TaxID=925818 RepID=UPI00074F81A4|nr:hypothetical protein [Methylobacterium sp. AMS5]AMB47848.1 hypothetical protein Y590_23090 [Methylobacterium sp. AMS5]